jgi:hypothetical protein
VDEAGVWRLPGTANRVLLTIVFAIFGPDYSGGLEYVKGKEPAIFLAREIVKL